MYDGRFDNIDLRILELEGKILRREKNLEDHLGRVETLLHSFFFILNQKADKMTTAQEQFQLDLNDVQAASAAQGVILQTLSDEVVVAVGALDDLAKKIADAIAGAADFTALSAQAKAIKDAVIAATQKASDSTAALADAVTRDDPPVVVPPVEPPVEPPVVEPPVETPPAV